jgi:hypothetical protein
MTWEMKRPSLWFGQADVARVRKLVAEGEPTAQAIARLCQAQADRAVEDVVVAGLDKLGQRQTNDGELFLTGCAVTYLLTGKVEYAAKAYRVMQHWTADWTPSDLRLGSMALHGAVVSECCFDGWTREQQLAVTRLLVKMHEGFKVVNEGNPHQVGNNWWAITHSGAMVAAMAAHGRAVTDDGRVADMSEGIAWARGRLRAFASHFGDAGIYHEGLGYQLYTVSMLLPAMAASRRFDGVDFLEWYPHLQNMAASLYATACARRPLPDSTAEENHFGAMLSWNDAGQAWAQSNVGTLMIAFAPARLRGGLRVMFDRLNGMESGNQSFAPGAAGWFFHLFFYPFESPAENPDRILPRSIYDGRQGMFIWRNRYRDGDDAVVGCYARATHVGGHAQDDAGSVRFMALGHDWIMGGGQARPDAEWQSVVTAVDDAKRERNRCGHVMWNEADECGFVFGMDLRKVHGGYSERYVAGRATGNEDAPVWLAILDLVDDHRCDRRWVWNLTFAADLKAELREDLGGFDLVAADGCRARARFLTSRPGRLEVLRMPASKRSFSGGGVREYPGREYVRAEFAREEHLAIYTVITVQRGEGPEISRADGVAVRIGAERWERPFGAAIPSGFRPGMTGGLCRCPSGQPGFRVH